MLIRTYATFWNPQLVNWGRPGAGNKGQLLGTTEDEGKNKKKPAHVDAWNGAGIYVLFHDFRPIYIGKAVDTCVGLRLRNHLADRFAQRWDAFSFYLVNKVNTVGQRLADTPGTRNVSAAEIVNTLESMLIDLANPPLNRKRESIPEASHLDQVMPQDHRGIQDYLELILAKPEKPNGNA